MQDTKIKPWYKMTEIGVIPKDWNIKNLWDTSTLKARIGWQGLTTAEYKKNWTYLLITWTDFNKGFIAWDTCHYVESIRYNQDKNIQIREWDVLVTKDWTIWKVALVKNLPKKATLNSWVFVIRPIQNNYLSIYFYNILLSRYFKSFLFRLTAWSTISHLYQKDFVTFNFPCPNNINEQKKIAEVLMDTDELITSLDELINKKEKIKEWTMHELLTWKRRLPWFSWEWEKKKMSDIFDVTRWYVLSAKEMNTTKSDIYKYPVYSSQTKRKWLAWYYKNFLYEDAITWTTDWAHAWDVNYREWKFYCTNVCWVLKSTEWYANLCIAKALWLISKQYVSYIGNPKLMNNVVADIELYIPSSIDEQQAISEILSTIDNEIEQLEIKRNKYKQTKEWMMQELLTGRIRLV